MHKWKATGKTSENIKKSKTELLKSNCENGVNFSIYFHVTTVPQLQKFNQIKLLTQNIQFVLHFLCLRSIKVLNLQ